MTHKPTIGITKPDRKDRLAYLAICMAVKLAGGVPLKIEPSSDYESHDIQGLILGGGKDVFPELYKEASDPEYQYDHDRDQMEIHWARKALDGNIPTLGICRGAQLMNIVCGGTLHKSVREAYEDAKYPDGLLHHMFYRKKAFIIENTLLHTILGRKSLSVNSIHKQAIAVLGENLVINAQEINTVVQGMAHKKHPFFLGIQFHPEFLIHRKMFRDIFSALVIAAQNKDI